MMSSGPFILKTGDSVIVTFALIAGDNLADIQASAIEAGILYNHTGINEMNNKLNFAVYPDPVSDNLTIDCSQQAIIEITNIQGQLIETHTASSNKTSIDVSALPCGVYIVKVITENGVGVEKFIKE